MRNTIYLICISVFLQSCTEVLRQPNFELQGVENSDETVRYDVTGYDVTPSIVARANASPFVRYVNLGRRGTDAVRRVPEASLFSGPKPPANVRPAYRIGVGDSVTVSRSGHIQRANGVETRQVLEQRYIVDENGMIALHEGRLVRVAGQTISEATSALRRTLSKDAQQDEYETRVRDFPVAQAQPYRLGVGDIIRVSRLTEASNAAGVIDQEIQTSQSKIGSDGTVSILQLGEIDVAGFTLPEVRDRVIQEAIRTASGLDTVVEIQTFASQSAFVFGDFGTRVVPLTDKLLTYDRFIASLNPSFEGGRDYRVQLERDGEVYVMSARSIVLGSGRDKYFVLDGDRIVITEKSPRSEIQLSVSEFGARNVTYLRVNGGTQSPGVQQAGMAVPFDLRGLDMRQLLVQQRIDVDLNKDLLVKLSRSGRTYSLSAQSVVLKAPSRRYWLAPDDHVVVEDIAYVGDTALLVGEIRAPRQLSVNKHSRTTLAQALFDGDVFSAVDADFQHVYILRGEGMKFDAFHFDISQVLNLSLAEKFELRPGDIMFVRTRPLTRYSRALAVALTFVNGVDVGLTNARTFGR